MAYLIRFSRKPSDQAQFRFDPPEPKIDRLSLYRGVTFSPDQVPTRAIVSSGHKQCPSVLSIGVWFGACDAFRKLVEAREPGVHQFFPVEIVLRGGATPLEPYFIFNIRQQIDAVVVERSEIEWIQNPGRPPTMFPPNLMSVGESPYPLVLSREAIAGRRVWRGLTQFSMYPFFSDDLMTAFRQLGMRGLNVKKCEEM